MDTLIQFVPFIAIFGLMWLLLIKPQNDERKAHEALVASLAKDDRVVTQSGIHGRIVGVSEQTVVLEIAEKTRVTLDKNFVARRVESDT